MSPKGSGAEVHLEGVGTLGLAHNGAFGGLLQNISLQLRRQIGAAADHTPGDIDSVLSVLESFPGRS